MWKDELPNLRKFMKDGVYGILESTIPPITCPAWNCFMTGKNPGKIGVFDFQQVQFNVRAAAKIVDSTSQEGSSLWEILSNYNKKIGVVNVPMTYPPTIINGFMVSGFSTPLSSRDYTYPPELLLELEKEFGKYEVDHDIVFPEYKITGQEGFLEEVYNLEEKKLEVTKYLMKTHEWDFFIAVFMMLDRIQHNFWHYMDKNHPKYNKEHAKNYKNVIKNGYLKLDAIIGELLELIDEDTIVIIMSDHGFGTHYGSFFSNVWLETHGLLRESVQPTHKIKNFLSKHISPSNKMIKLLSKTHLIEKLAKERLNQKRDWLKNILSMHKADDPFLKSRAYLGIDWSKTKAYCWGYGRIFINLKGRESEGIIKPGPEYERVREIIINKLKQIKHPITHQRIPIRIYRKEDLYWGKHSDNAPDIIFIMDDFRYTQKIELGRKKLWEIPVLRTGEHRIEGLWMISGSNVQKSKKLNAKIIDLAPTILHLLNVPIPVDMDGRVLEEALSIRREISYSKPFTKVIKSFEYSKEEEEEIKQRLAHLGYF
jgi:predicted AlkP superfamily phosphohydrolase/phosphomutase